MFDHALRQVSDGEDPPGKLPQRLAHDILTKN